MSRFSDFNDFLNQEEIADEKEHNHYVQTVLNSRKQLDPTITDLLELFRDFFETILAPRKPLVMVLKKQGVKETAITEDHGDGPFWFYRINLNDQDMLLPAFEWTGVVNEGFFQPGSLTKHDWHPYVAMQFDLAIFDTKVHDHYTGNLFPEITIRVWGEIGESTQQILPIATKLSYRSDYKIPFAIFTISGEQLSPEQMKQTVTDVLMRCTPNVLQHDKTVWKIPS